MGLVLVLRHKLLCMHVFKGLMRCKSICDVKPGLDPCPLLARSWNRWWLDFVSFKAYKKVKIKFKKAKCVSNRCNDLFKRKKYFGFRCTLIQMANDIKCVAMAATGPELKALQTPLVIWDWFTLFCEFLKRESRTDWIREMNAACTNFISAVHRAQFLEICARPESFWSTPRIATSGKVQFRKSMIHGLPVNMSMLRVKYYKSDWLKRLLCAFSENWTFPEVAILGVDQKERSLWGGEYALTA